jgi:hypothetical protein
MTSQTPQAVQKIATANKAQTSKMLLIKQYANSVKEQPKKERR